MNFNDIPYEIETRVAILGYAIRIPGADSPDTFWQRLKKGNSALQRFDLNTIKQHVSDADLLEDPNFVPVHGVIPNIDRFDAQLFGYSPREAEYLEPQQRILLELAWESLEKAGIDPNRTKSRIGVFTGVGSNQYAQKLIYPFSDRVKSVNSHMLMLGNEKDYSATRIAYKLNLNGPAINIQTACSTGLTAVHTATQQLLSAECDVAMAGACSLQIPQQNGYLYSEGGILSKTGQCLPFDANADGTVGGSGGVMVVLKRLEDAIRDKDTIYGVIAGSAVNNDGSQKAGFTAPSVGGQISVMSDALTVANLEPSQIGFIEAHGTGTEVGDPIELAALHEVYGHLNGNGNPCYIGAVKAITGHLDTASGLVGLIKTILALRNEEIPGNTYFRELNPRFELPESRLKIHNRTVPWNKNGSLRRASVSSLGLGGTNVHMILEEPPNYTDGNRSYFEVPQIIPLSAKNLVALQKNAENIENVCDQPNADLNDISYTMREGRMELDWRLVLIRDTDGGKSSFKPQKIKPEHNVSVKNVFLFPGQGAQYDGMGSQLYRYNRVFKKHADELLTLAEEVMPGICTGFFEKGILPDTVSGSQICIFLLQRALTRLWEEIGIEPDIVMGHSLGEYSAAVTAGSLQEIDAIRILHKRGTLIETMPEGAMLTVLSDWETIRNLSNGKCEPAANNATGIMTVSGSLSDIQSLENKLDQNGITSVRLQSNRAFHTQALRQISEPLYDLLQKIEMDSPSIPWISTHSGSPIDHLKQDYWIEQMLQTVQFQKACANFTEKESYRFFEIGPGSQLSGLIRRNLSFVQKSDLMSTLDETEPEWRGLLNGTAQCWMAGEQICWSALYPDSNTRKISLPVYPFANTTYWLSTPDDNLDRANSGRNKNRSTISDNADEWFYRYSFERSEKVTVTPGIVQDPVLLISDDPFGDGLSTNLKCEGKISYLNAVDSIEHFLHNHKNKRIHICCYIGTNETPEKLYQINKIVSYLTTTEQPDKIRFSVIGLEGMEILGSESVQPSGSAVSTMLRDIQLQSGLMSLNYVDTDKNHTPVQVAGFLSLIEDASGGVGYREYLYRGGYRWHRTFHRVSTDKPKLQETNVTDIKEGDLCMITGGTGALGLHLSSWLSKNKCGIILLSRSREEDLPLSSREKIDELRKSGTQLQLLQADITRKNDLKNVRDFITNHFEKEVDHLFHLAGTVSEKEWNELTMSEFISGFRVKSDGLLNLMSLVDLTTLKSVTLYSSLSIYTGGFAGPAYSASCAWMDSLAGWIIPADKLRILNWAGWKDHGMAVKLAEKRGLSESQREIFSLDAFSETDGFEVLDKIMKRKVDTTIISKRDLRSMINGQESKFSQDENENIDLNLNMIPNDNSTEERYKRPDIGVQFIEPVNDTESKLAQIWQTALGLEQVGTNDNFFDLGADSMLMIRITEKINHSFSKSISKTDLFEFTTIKKLASYLAEKREDKEDSSTSTSTSGLKNRADKKREAADQQAKRAIEARKLRNK